MLYLELEIDTTTNLKDNVSNPKKIILSGKNNISLSVKKYEKVCGKVKRFRFDNIIDTFMW